MSECTCGNPFIKENVIEACKAAITEILDDRREMLEKVIAPYRKPFKKYGLFGKTIILTHEEAVQYADKATYGVVSANNLYWEQYDLSQEILTVANNLGEHFINLSTKEFNAIARWYHI